MSTIREIINEAERGCGYRREGGLYFVSAGVSVACGKLPVALKVCPCCGGGIKPSLGFTWINPSMLVPAGECSDHCRKEACSMYNPPDKSGLIWIGQSFYKSAQAWLDEAQTQGVSRKIGAIPRDFVVGKTMVFVAHREAITNADGTKTAGIFHAFVPDRIEYIVKGNETPEELDHMESRGIALVKLIRTDGAGNKMKWKRGRNDSKLLEYTTEQGYSIISHNGKFFVLRPGDMLQPGCTEAPSYELAKGIAEGWEKARRLAVK